jgi:hypothetical protein
MRSASITVRPLRGRRVILRALNEAALRLSSAAVL